jgi:hypothetical protein
MKRGRLKCGFAMIIGVFTAATFIGTVGQLPYWGETAPAALGASLLGLWTLGTVVLGAASSRARPSR